MWRRDGNHNDESNIFRSISSAGQVPGFLTRGPYGSCGAPMATTDVTPLLVVYMIRRYG